MRVLLHRADARPLLSSTAAAARGASRYGVAPRMDILDELKYQLSNSDEGTRPARDLVENPVAAAYLVVLAIFGAGLAFLVYSDTQTKARREAALREQEQAASMLRAQGLEDEAAALERDLKREKKAAAAKPKPAEPKGLAADPFADDEGNRFERRQGRAAQRKKKKGGKRGGASGKRR